MRTKYIRAGCQALMVLALTTTAAQAEDRKTLERGRFLVQVGGCNDCHTPGYAESDGKTPQGEWLVGSPVGFSGPWGTTYPGNLRLLAQNLSESAWLTMARAPMRPPMPTPSLRAMSDRDLVAMYRFIRSLGARGDAAPAYVGPGASVATPYIDFVPKNLPPRRQAAK